MADEKIERVYTVPLGKAYEYTRTKRSPRAVKLLREFISRHMKADASQVRLSNRLNSSIWERSIQKPPRRVKVRVIKSDELVKVYLPDEVTDEEKKAQKDKEKKERAEKLKKEMEAKKLEAQKKEAKPSGTENPKPKAEKPPEAKKEEPKKEAKEEKK